jgi:hypothetical protein
LSQPATSRDRCRDRACPVAHGLRGRCQVEASPRDQPAAGEETLDFEAPLGALGVRVQDFAKSGLPFVAVVPVRAEAVIQEFVYAPPNDPSAAVAALVYEDPAWGRVLMLQYSDTQTQRGLLEWEATLKGGGCSPVPDTGFEGAQACSYDPFEPVELPHGVVALLGSSKERTSITWIDTLRPAGALAVSDFSPNDSLTVEIMGDPGTFSPQEAVEFAELALAVS